MVVDLKNINFATVFSKTLPAKPERDRSINSLVAG